MAVELPTAITPSCDPDGCDFNSFRMGNTTYGAGMAVDANKFTTVAQFLTNDGTAAGTLSEIRRIYVWDDIVIQNSNLSTHDLSHD